MWYLTSPDVRSIISKSIRRLLLHLLLVPVSLNHQNPFNMSLPTADFSESLFQCVLIDVGNMMSQTILVKIVQSPKPTNQLKFRRLSSSLTFSFSVKILKHDIPTAMIIMISQKMI